MRSSRHTLTVVLAAVVISIVGAACGGASATPAPTPTPKHATASPTAKASASAVPSGSGPVASASPSDQPIQLPHLDPKLEQKLPGELGGLPMASYSISLAVLLGATNEGVTVLYTPWLVSLGKTADQVTLAVATDPTKTENVIVEAFAVPGASDSQILSTFSDAAVSKGWPVSTKEVAKKTCLQITNPNPTGPLSIGYAYAKGGVLYVVITDDAALLVEAYIKLP